MVSSKNSRAELSLIQSTSQFHPNQILRPRVSLSNSNDYTSLSLRFIGTARGILMGQDRLQMGVQANMGGGGSAQLITSNESLEYFNIEAQLVSPDNAAAGAEEKKSNRKSANLVQGGIFEVLIPEIQGEILPTFLEMSDSDPARISMSYRLELIGKRSGIFKMNDKLTLDVFVTIPQKKQISERDLLESNWTTHSIEKPLKFQTSAGGPLLLQATIAVRPLLSPTEPIQFTLHLSTTSSQLFEVSSIDASIARAIRTTPLPSTSLSSASSGAKDFNWARIRIAHLRGLSPSLTEEEAGKKWSGEINIPKHQVTLDSQLIGVRYFVGCQVFSKSLRASPLIIQLEVFIPSTATVVVEPSSEEREEEEGKDQLPEYIA